MPTDEINQVGQLAQQALAAPINNLIAVIALGGILAILFFIFVGYKALPVITRIFTSLTESYKAMAVNIEKLTALEAQSTNTSNIIIDEMRKQTAVIELSSIKTHDTLTENTAAIRDLIKSFTELRSRVDEVLKGIDDKADRDEVDKKIEELQDTLIKAAETAKRKTDSQPIPVISSNEVKEVTKEN